MTDKKNNLVKLSSRPKTGNESFNYNNENLELCLGDFWRWGLSLSQYHFGF